MGTTDLKQYPVFPLFPEETGWEMVPLEKLLFIVNPCAGQKKIHRHLAEIIGLFNRQGYEVTVYTTAYSGHGTQIVRERIGEFQRVVCAGGDGTLNEVITGVLQAGSTVPIGYIPCGSTNDFASTLGLPGNLLQSAEIAATGEPKPHDVGQFDQRYFSYVASFGAFTRTSYSTPQNVKNALGHLAYVLEGIQELTQIRQNHVRFEYDGGVVEDDFIFGAISNSTSVGGVLTLNPEQVDLQDGKFELLLIRSPKDTAELRDCILALREQRYDCSMVTFRSVSRLTVYPDSAMPWSLDGERADGGTEIHIENLHHGIQIIHPKEESPC